MSMRTSDQTWMARCRYPGMAPFWLGTVIADGSEHARVDLAKLWQELSPHPPPEFVRIVPGTIVVNETA